MGNMEIYRDQILKIFYKNFYPIIALNPTFQTGIQGDIWFGFYIEQRSSQIWKSFLFYYSRREQSYATISGILYLTIFITEGFI